MRLHQIAHRLHLPQVGEDCAQILGWQLREAQPRHEGERTAVGDLWRTVLHVVLVVVELLQEEVLLPFADSGVEIGRDVRGHHRPGMGREHLAGGEGQYAIITASLTDANQNEWIRWIKARMASEHPKMELATIHPCDGQRDKAMTEAKNIIAAYPGVKAILAICSPALPGAAEALKQENARGVRLTGLSTPNLCRSYVNRAPRAFSCFGASPAPGSAGEQIARIA